MARFSKVTAFCVLILTATAFARRGTNLPSAVQNQQKPIEEKFHKFWKKFVLDGLLNYDYDTWFRRFVHVPSQLKKTAGSKLSCPSLKDHPTPNSVHRVTPKDIKVIAALGDSATAAFGARSSNLMDIFVEFRGIAWSIGGDGTLERVLTLPNILKKYNPLIKGFSTKVTPVSDLRKKLTGYNFAKTGSTAEGMAEKAEELISQMKKGGETSMKNDWKILTIFIGQQDLCLSCFERDYAAKNYIKKISKTLERIKEKLPRVLVNLVQVYDITKLYLMTSSYCKSMLMVTCPCVAAGAKQREYVSQTAHEYSRMLEDLVNSPKFRDTKDFAVVLQPFTAEEIVPRKANGMVDESYLAPDCFHLSAKGQAAMAAGLWNNMLEPVGEKSTTLPSDNTLHCPRPTFPYFFTKTNSKEYKKFQNRGTKWLFPFREGYQVRQSAHTRESEGKEKSESETEVRRRSLGIAIGSGVAVAAVAVGIAVYAMKRKRRAEEGDGIVRDKQQNYNSCDQETLL